MAQSATCINRLLRASALAATVMAAAACSPTLERITPGTQTRDDVAELLGTPSSVAAFSEDTTWIYIQSKTSTLAFFEPKVLERNIVVVDFDDAGIVKDVRRYTLEDGKLIDPVSRTTPAPGKELSFLEQLVGNVGRFNANSNRR
jgi:outer membrane protein assembly factor BamE (lipoprotein component of BamABCDE complex)